MEALLNKYAGKLTAQGLCDAGSPLLGGIDAEFVWNRDDAAIPMLAEITRGLNINSILYAAPAEPYASLLNFLAEHDGGAECIRPEDSETRTFLHDIPLVREFSAPAVTAALKKRKGAVIPGRGIVTWGTVSPEQAFVTFSSICFASFVKFFSDAAVEARRGGLDPNTMRRIVSTIAAYDNYVSGALAGVHLFRGPFEARGDAIGAIIQAGRRTVECRLVDSFFGNISYRLGGVIYVSQTGSSLDELAGCIDPCPVDNSSCAGITASSEFSAHREIYSRTAMSAILHGHPKFSVIMSMLCDKKDTCANRGSCHKSCAERRFVCGVPIVPGEVGTGPYGLCNTLPPAIAGRRGAIVYGHGLFTTGERDFTDAFQSMVDIELMCVKEYRKIIETL